MKPWQQRITELCQILQVVILRDKKEPLERVFKLLLSCFQERGSFILYKRKENERWENHGEKERFVQGGYTPKNGEPRVLPLYQSTTYKYDTSDDLAALFNLEAEGYIYTRIGNPTLAAFEQKLSDLEGG